MGRDKNRDEELKVSHKTRVHLIGTITRAEKTIPGEKVKVVSHGLVIASPKIKVIQRGRVLPTVQGYFDGQCSVVRPDGWLNDLKVLNELRIRREQEIESGSR